MDSHRTPEAAAFFRFMAQNEQKHGDELAARREALFGGAVCTVSRSQLFDVEAPEYDEARAFMSPRQAMQAALRCEEKAHAFFVAALPGIQDSAVRALFEELRDEETLHQELVLKELAKLPVGPEADPSDYVDEPVAQ
jgi:rubrerythrin